MNFSKVLREGKRELEEFKLSGNSGSTGIDRMNQPYLEQMIELNNYVNTTASTNFPEDDTFQEMFVFGWISKEVVTEAFLNYLEQHNIYYAFVHHPGGCCPGQNDVGTTIKEWFPISQEELINREIMHDMLGKWFYESNNDGDNENVYELNKRFLDTPMSKCELQYRFKEAVNQVGFVKAYETLTEEDYIILRDIREYFSTKYNEYYKPEIPYESGRNSSSYCCHAKELIKRGEVLEFNIVNIYDPTDRNLYKTLLEYFQSN